MKIYSYQVGISNNENGIVNFYDGIIKGKDIITGEITNIPNNTEIEITRLDDNIKSANLVAFKGPVAQIGDTLFTSLKEAFASVESNLENTTIVKLLRDIAIINEEMEVSIKENQKIYLDMNQHLITFESKKGLTNFGELEIGINQELPNISLSNFKNNGEYYFENDGTGAMVSNNNNLSTTASSYIEIDLRNITGLVEINLSAQTVGAYDDKSYAVLTEDTTIPSNSNAIMSVSGSTNALTYRSEIEGGKLYYLHFVHSIANYGSETRESLYKIYSIKLGYPNNNLLFSSNNYMTNHGNLKVLLGGNIYSSSPYGIYNSGGNITFDGGYIKMPRLNSTTKYGIYNENAGEITIKSGKIILSSSAYSPYGTSFVVYNKDNGTINLEGGLLQDTSSEKGTGIYNNSTGEINISGGGIHIGSSKTSYGIYNNSINKTNINRWSNIHRNG